MSTGAGKPEWAQKRYELLLGLQSDLGKIKEKKEISRHNITELQEKVNALCPNEIATMPFSSPEERGMPYEDQHKVYLPFGLMRGELSTSRNDKMSIEKGATYVPYSFSDNFSLMVERVDELVQKYKPAAAAAPPAAAATEEEWEDIGAELSKVPTLVNAIRKKDAFGIEGSFKAIRKAARDDLRTALENLPAEILKIKLPDPVPEGYGTGVLKELPPAMEEELNQKFPDIDTINQDVTSATLLPSNKLKEEAKKAFDREKWAAMDEMKTENSRISTMKQTAKEFLLNKLREKSAPKGSSRQKRSEEQLHAIMLAFVNLRHDLQSFLSKQS